MFVEELGAQLGLLRVIAIEADHIDGDVAALGHQAVDLFLVGAYHFLLAGARLDPGGGLPAIETHALLGQGRGDIVEMGQHLVRQVRAGYVVNGQAAHLGNSSLSAVPCGFFQAGQAVHIIRRWLLQSKQALTV